MEAANTPDPGTGPLSMDQIAASLLTPPRDKQDDGEPAAAKAAPAVDTSQDTGDDDTGQSNDQEAKQLDQTTRKVPVKIDGKDVEVDEAELRASYLRQSDYTRKTQEVADQRKALDTEKQAIASLRSQEIAQLNQALEWAKGKLPQPPVYDPNNQAGYLDAKVRYDAEMAEFGRAVEAMNHRQQELSRQQQEQTKATLRDEGAKLLEAIPEWKDESKRNEGQKAVGKYLSEQGFSSDDLSGVTDHRVVNIARKAMLYDQLQASKAVVEKKVSTAPPVLKPGASNTRQVGDDTRSLQRFAKTGRVDDMAAALIVRRK